ncbi:unnamed protein product [Prorocentrum cordatum]|uniref:Uncharacterized protein n=1 Tax=Prorocentrum cordatum TaxID=2364126 RepID=A0ABN9WM37_9DINO|nr:unnamed protein product [Polarella glacialis]
MPFSEQAMLETFRDKYQSSISRLRGSSGGSSPHAISVEVPDRCAVLGTDARAVAVDARLLWGCAGCLQNVCALEKTQEFRNITCALSKWVDAPSKERRESADEVLCLVGGDSGPHPRLPLDVVHVMLGPALMSPKVQTYVLCLVDGAESIDFKMGRLRRLPCDLHLGTVDNRLCRGFRRPRTSLAFRASDELADLLVKCRRGDWVARPVQQHIRTDARTLLAMTTTGFGDEFALSTVASGVPAKKKNPAHDVPDVVLAACAQRRERSETAGFRAAATSASSPPAHAPGASATQPTGSLPELAALEDEFAQGIADVEPPELDIGSAIVEDIEAVIFSGDGALIDEPADGNGHVQDRRDNFESLSWGRGAPSPPIPR